VYACSLTDQVRIKKFAPNLATAFPVPRKLGTTKNGAEVKVVWRRRLQKQRPQSPKTAMLSIPGEDFFCSSETMHDRQTVPGPELFVSQKKLQKQTTESRKLLCLS
jgi:hypothetical protein